MTDILIVGDTQRSAELRHEIPVDIVDTFLYAEVRGRRVAIGTVARGEVHLPPQATKLLLKEYREQADPDTEALHKLSSREQEVLALTAEGYSSKEIGEKLFISPKTVDTYRSRIMEKLGLSHRSELVRFALKVGLLRQI